MGLPVGGGFGVVMPVGPGVVVGRTPGCPAGSAIVRMFIAGLTMLMCMFSAGLLMLMRFFIAGIIPFVGMMA